MKITCPHRLTSPEEAGYDTAERLREMAEKYPHLRPCKPKGGGWIERKTCWKCKDAVREEAV